MTTLSLGDRMMLEAGFLPLSLRKKRKNQDEDEWITVNGTHVLLNEEGKAQSGGKLKGKDFSKAQGGRKSSGALTVSESLKPKNTDYDYTLDEDFEDFQRKNAGNKRNPKGLLKIYEGAEQNGENGFEAVRDEYYKTRLAMCSKDFEEIGRDKAEEILGDNIRPGTRQAWFREYNHEAKEGLTWQMTRSPEVHNAALNQMYTNYKYKCQADETEPLSYKEFLMTLSVIELYFDITSLHLNLDRKSVV